MEDERFDLLPGGIFNKGFVRAYARCVGLDEEKTVAEYLDAAKLATPEIDMQAMSSQVSAARAAHEPGVSAATVVGVIALIVALGMGAVWLKERRKDSREQAAAQHVAENSGASAAPSASIPAPPTVASAPNHRTRPQRRMRRTAQTKVLRRTCRAPVSKVARQNVHAEAQISVVAGCVSGACWLPVEISVSATARAWISVRSDGKTVETLTLDPEKPEARTRSYKAKEKLTLMVGNPAGLSVTYNGKPAGTLGAVGHPTTVTFTPQGMEKQ